MWKILILASVVLLAGCTFRYLHTEVYYQKDLPAPFTLKLDGFYDAITTKACEGDTAGDSFLCAFFVALVDQLKEDTTGQIPSPENPLNIDVYVRTGFRGVHLWKLPIIPGYTQERMVRVVVK